MTSPTGTDWIREGARAVVVTEGAHGTKVQPDTVTGVTERYVVTEKSGKFRRRDMRPAGQPEYSTTVVRVLRPDDPYIATARARIRVRNLGRLVAKTTSQFAGDVAAALVALDEIEQAVRAARQAITGKEA